MELNFVGKWPDNKQLFSDLKQGDPFILSGIRGPIVEGEGIFIKIMTTATGCNAVHISTGSLAVVKPDDIVRVISACVTINRGAAP